MVLGVEDALLVDLATLIVLLIACNGSSSDDTAEHETADAGWAGTALPAGHPSL